MSSPISACTPLGASPTAWVSPTALSSRLRGRTSRAALHDRGKLIVQIALMLAGGGESCADIEHLRCEEGLFGDVASDSTVHRAFHEITPKLRIRARRGSRRGALARSGGAAEDQGTGPVYLDIDASLVEIHSENKQQTAATYKGGFGFHPILCFADATGEALSGLLRPGNAGSNTVTDHVLVLDGALAQLPGTVRAGHREGDEASLVGRRVVCRTDSAGSTAGFVAALVSRNIGFFTVAATNSQIQAAIFDAEGVEGVWLPARDRGGELRDGSAVCELTPLVDLSSWPELTRLIVSRQLFSELGHSTPIDSRNSKRSLRPCHQGTATRGDVGLAEAYGESGASFELDDDGVAVVDDEASRWSRNRRWRVSGVAWW